MGARLVSIPHCTRVDRRQLPGAIGAEVEPHTPPAGCCSNGDRQPNLRPREEESRSSRGRRSRGQRRCASPRRSGARLNLRTIRPWRIESVDEGPAREGGATSSRLLLTPPARSP